MADFGITKTLAERSAEMIRARIVGLSAGYEPGSRLYPNSVGRGARREPYAGARSACVARGGRLCGLSPRRGATVFRPGEDELRDLLEVQEWLELLAVRLVSARVQLSGDGAAESPHLEACNAAIDACEQAVERGDTATYRTENTRFHRSLIAAAGNGQLTSAYEMLMSKSELLSVYFPRLTQDVLRSVEEHRELLSALKAGDGNGAEAALHAHWTASRDRIAREYRDHPAVESRVHQRREPTTRGSSVAAAEVVAGDE